MLNLQDQKDFSQNIKELYASQSSKTFLQKKAWEVLQEKGLPSPKEENFRYLPLEYLYEKNFPLAGRKSPQDFSSEILPGFSEKLLVFVDGRFEKEFSSVKGIPSSVVILSERQAVFSYAFFLHNQFAKSKKENPFSLLNDAFSGEGVFVYIPKNQTNLSLQMVHIVTQPAFTSPKVQFIVGEGSDIEVYESYLVEKKEEAFFVNAKISASLQEKASFSIKRYFPKSQGVVFSSLESSLEKEASLQSFQYSEGSILQKNFYHILLQGEKCHASLEGVNLVEGKDYVQTQIVMHHQCKETTSNQKFKAAVKKNGTHSFDGLIQVEKEALQTEAYQLSQNLLLEKGSSAFAKPQLKIYADEVKASHGATVCKLSQEELFYLQARGIPREEAIKLLTQAFLQELQEKLGLYKPIFQKKLDHWIGS